MGSVDSNLCKMCGHTKEDHKGTAMICMKQIGENPSDLCDCCRFDDNKETVLPETLEAFVIKRKESTHENISPDDSKT